MMSTQDSPPGSYLGCASIHTSFQLATFPEGVPWLCQGCVFLFLPAFMELWVSHPHLSLTPHPPVSATFGRLTVRLGFNSQTTPVLPHELCFSHSRFSRVG